MPTKAIQTHRAIAVGTPLGDDVLLLRSFTYAEQVGRPFEMALDMLSDDSQLDFDKIVGQKVTVRVQKPRDDKARYFNGVVAQFVQTRLSGRTTQYQATVVPWFWLLTRTSDCRIFQDMKVPDIIKQIFRERGFSDFEDRLSGSYRKWEYCVQYRETDFNFISRLMEQEGIYYFFEHENNKHQMILADSKSSHKPFPAYAEIQYRPPVSEFREKEYIHDWTCSREVQPGVYAHTDFDFKSPKKDLLAKSQIIRGHAVPKMEIYDYPGEYEQRGEGETYSRQRIEELQAQYEVHSGGGDVRGIATGCKFTLQEHPRGDINKEYLVVSSTIQAATDEYDSAPGGAGRGGGVTFSSTFSAIDLNTAFRSARITPKPMIRGPQTAIVVGPSGEEIYTDKYGRVKVQFHWDRYSKADENSSCWIRVAQIWAGKVWGGMFIPRIGQEVIVEFLEGDPDRPIITGRVYNGEAMPPYELPSMATVSTVKSNSSKGGKGFNEIRFEDKKNSEQIFVHAQKDQDIRVKNDCREWIGQDRHLIVKRDQLEKVERDQHLIVKGSKAAKIEKDEHLHVVCNKVEKIDADSSLTVGGQFQEKVGTKYASDVGQEIHLKAGMKVVIEAGMQLTIKASGGFVDIGPAGVTIQGTLVNINSGGAAGSGSGSSPQSPKDPEEAKEADTAESGEVTTAKGKQAPQKEKITLRGADVKDMQQAAFKGTVGGSGTGERASGPPDAQGGPTASGGGSGTGGGGTQTGGGGSLAG